MGEEKRVTVSPFRFSLLLFFLETLDTQANKRHASKVELELCLTCEQALQGALPAGQEKEGEHVTTYLEFDTPPPNPLWLPVN